MKRILIGIGAGTFAIISNAVGAAGFALGAKVGTLGLGVEATTGLSERVNLRFGANNYSYSFNETTSGIRYDADLDLKSGALLLDWHPFGGVFRMSLGYLYNKNALDLTATPTTPQTIGDQTYDPDEIGTLTGSVKFKKSVPYAGLGWGNAAKGRGLGFSAELGAMFQGSPEVTLRGNGGLAGDPAFEADLRREEQEAEDDLKDFKIYPVVSFGLSYRF